MGGGFLCELVVLTICARAAALGLNSSGSQELAIVAGDNESFTSELTAVATTEQSSRNPRWQRHEREGFKSRGSHDDYQEELDLHHDEHDSKAMSQGKYDYWGGYYDFLINEGSYKFWAVFQLATAALLIYSGFAALYYAKVNPQITEDYDDFLLRRRRRRRRRRRGIDRDRPPRDRAFFGFEPQSLQRILDSIAKEIH